MSIRVALELPLPELTLAALVGVFTRTFQECAREALEHLLGLMDQWLLEHKEPGHQVAHIERGRSIRTPIGLIRLVHRQMRRPGGKGHYSPLLRLLELRPRQRIIDGYAKMAVTAALYCSFRKAVAGTGVDVSHSYVWGEFQKHGAEVRKNLAIAMAYHEQGDPSATRKRAALAVVMVDGIYYRVSLTDAERAQRELQRKALWERKQQARAERQRKELEARQARQARKNESKVEAPGGPPSGQEDVALPLAAMESVPAAALQSVPDAAVESVPVEEERAPRRSKSREAKVARLVLLVPKEDGTWETIGPYVYSDCVSAERFMKDCAIFFNAVAGLHRVDRILVMSDGCSWGRSLCRHYPGKAFWQLDWWHLWRAVKKGCRVQEGLYDQVWDLLNAEKLDGALSLLKKTAEKVEQYLALCRQKLDEVQQDQELVPLRRSAEKRLKKNVKHLHALVTYLDNNRDGVYGVKNAPEAAGGWIWGTGPVERLQGVMVGYRMKKQGRTWSEAGADNMLAALMELWNRPLSGPELARLLEENAEWERLCAAPTLHQEACGLHRRRYREGHLPALCFKRTGTSGALRAALLGQTPLMVGGRVKGGR